jgi:hypothetical protein
MLKIFLKIILKIINIIRCLKRELIAPLTVRFYEKIAYSTCNPYWQERANAIKDIYNKNDKKKVFVGKKHNIVGIICLIAVVWMVIFHYRCDEKRSNYEVFFIGETAISKLEDWTTNTLLKIDEDSIECFYHNVIEVE